MNGFNEKENFDKKAVPAHKRRMDEFIFDKMLKYSPAIQVIIVALGTLLSFLIALFKGDVSIYLPFISETGANSPEMCIFSFSLMIGSFIGIIFIFFRYIILAQNPLNDNNTFWWMNSGSCIVGVTSMVGLGGVAAIPMSTVFWAHLLAATVYFVGSALYFATSTIITHKIHGQSRIYTFRFILTGCITALLAVMVIIFPMALNKWSIKNTILPALKTPENEGFALLFVSSLFEWTIVGIIILYNLSLIMEFKYYRIHITAKAKTSNPADNDCPPAPEIPST